MPITHLLIPVIEDHAKRLKDPGNHEETTNVATNEYVDLTTQHQDPNIKDPSPTLGYWIQPIMEYRHTERCLRKRKTIGLSEQGSQGLL